MILFGISSLLMACGTIIKVESNPEGADVYLLAPASQKKHFVGKTPIEIDLKEHAEKINIVASSRKYIRLIAEAKDYTAKEILVPVATLGNTQTVLRIKLDPYVSQSEKIRTVIQHLMNTQEFINAGQLKRAEFEVNRALSMEEENPWAYIMRGYIHLLNKDFSKSLSDYEKSLELDPANQEIIKRVSDIRKILKEKVKENAVR